MTINQHGLINLAFGILLAGVFLGQAWVNIVSKKVSGHSIDALVILLAKKPGTQAIQDRFSSFPRNKTEITILGICALLAGLKVIETAIDQVVRNSP